MNALPADFESSVAAPVREILQSQGPFRRQGAVSACGLGCFISLPEDGRGFTTIELFRCAQMILYPRV